MRVDPLHGGIVVKPINKTDEAKSGLINPAKRNHSGMRNGIIKTVSKNIDDERIKEGVEVFFLKDAGTELPVNGDVLLFIDYRELKGVCYDE